jgi:hypothetical protein
MSRLRLLPLQGRAPREQLRNEPYGVSCQRIRFRSRRCRRSFFGDPINTISSARRRSAPCRLRSSQTLRNVNARFAALTAIIALCTILYADACCAQTLDPEAIFFRASDVASLESCPSRIEYTIAVTASVNGRQQQNHYKATYLPGEDYLHVFAFSSEEQQAAETPHGTNVVITLPGNLPLTGLSRAFTNAVNHDDAVTDLLGVPDLKPLYSFGLRRRNRGRDDNPDTTDPRSPSATSAGTSLRTIGTTYARSRDYIVELLGIETLEGHQTYHLRLTPVRQPDRFRIRELWVDSSSFATVQLLSDGNFSAGPSTKSRWLTTYRDISGCNIIDSETALDVLNFGRNRKYNQTTLTFTVNDNSDAYRTPELIFRRPEGSDDLVEPDE